MAGPLLAWFALWPLNSAPQLGGAAGFQAWQVVTYSFLHGSLMHLFFNMFALYMFGGEIERTIGARRYVQYYFAAVVAAALTQLVVAASMHAPPYPTVGASGGIFGLLLAFGRFFPKRHHRAADPAHPDAGVAVRHAVRRDRARTSGSPARRPAWRTSPTSAACSAAG